MPQRHFLTNPTPLTTQVAGFLRRRDTAGICLITPTAGAGRGIGRALEALGCRPPIVRQPMQALLPESTRLASPVERCLAWSGALEKAPDSICQTLFWKNKPETASDRLRAARNFVHLGDELAEAALAPDTLRLPEPLASGFEGERWSALAWLYQRYLEILEDWQLEDPNAQRLKTIAEPTADFSHMVIAAVPDLPLAFKAYITALEARSIPVDLLVWDPLKAGATRFDAWGRPLAEWWNRQNIPLLDTQIHLAASTRDEAQLLARRVAEEPDTSALVAIDPKAQSLLASELRAAGLRPYLPGGKPLLQCEAAKLVLNWVDFSQSNDLRTLRRLLELPAFCRALDPESPLVTSEALIAIDHLLGKTIAHSLEGAWAASPPLPDSASPKEQAMRSRIRRLLGATRARLGSDPLSLLESAYPGPVVPESAQEVIRVVRGLLTSPALAANAGRDPGPLSNQLLAQAIAGETLQTPAAPGDVTLNGWLEAPWLPQRQLLLTGVIEGRLPRAVDGDPFLPDSLRESLRLENNTQRLARDSYLLSCLVATRGPEDLRLSLSKYNAEGDPNRPSRLLFRTDPADLPNRTLHLITPENKIGRHATRRTDWRWRLPDALPPVTKISPTEFEAYLACPFRFCITKVLRYEPASEAAYEMDAAVFGSLIHKVLEEFGKEAIDMGPGMLRMDESQIHLRVQALLEEAAQALFGPHPAPAVQVQLANAETRLHAFARIQAACFAEGWEILDVERKLSAGGDHPLHVGPLQLSGVIDRIERHAGSGQLRVMDYKTFSSLKKPAQAHLGPVSHNWLPAARVELMIGPRQGPKTWTNLQLPLYRRILEHWYPEATAQLAPQTAYFVLPSDPADSGVYPFEELEASRNPEAYPSAMTCAETVAGQIAAGVFWPPQPFRHPWEDPLAPLLVNGPAEACIHPDSIALLKGGAA